MKEDIPVKFWKDYEKADILNKEKRLNPIVKNFENILKIKDTKIRKHTLLLTLKSYFDDLIEYKDIVKIKEK